MNTLPKDSRCHLILDGFRLDLQASGKLGDGKIFLKPLHKFNITEELCSWQHFPLRQTGQPVSGRLVGVLMPNGNESIHHVCFHLAPPIISFHLLNSLSHKTGILLARLSLRVQHSLFLSSISPSLVTNRIRRIRYQTFEQNHIEQAK